ncbi:hypothetical protein [Thermus caldifontis]|uniref:hypothetical protein n=1 Tax=Thermus caldifontis TaxID=1930763 RepID=UPI000DF10FB4|nr:hypothetical protein [Thermus caldifontis]
MADLVASFRPTREFLLAIATFGILLGGILIAIGERERGIGYLIATGVGSAIAFAAEALLRGLHLLP